MKCKLRVLLAEIDLQPGVFAEEIKVNRGTISQLMNNKQDPTLRMAYKVTRGLRNHGLSVKVEDIWVEEE